MDNKDKKHKLYKFFNNKKSRIVVLKDEQLYFSTADEFNDPFDCYLGFDKDEFYYKCFLKLLKEKGLKEDLKVFVTQHPTFKTDTTVDPITLFILESKYLRNREEKPFNRIVSKVERLYKSYLKAFDELKKNIFVACFTENEPRNAISMWAYYANNHRGVCAMFDLVGFIHAFNKKEERDILARKFMDHLYKVKYSKSLNAVNVDKILMIKPEELKDSSYIRNLLMKVATTKHVCWSAEKEWRIVLSKEEAEEFQINRENRITSFPFLEGVTLGYKNKSIGSFLKDFSKYSINRLTYYNGTYQLSDDLNKSLAMHNIEMWFSLL